MFTVDPLECLRKIRTLAVTLPKDVSFAEVMDTPL